MASFQAKTGWDRPKKKENKSYRSDQFLPNPLQRIPKKIAKKFKKLKNTIMASFQAKIGWEGLEREKIKIIVPISSCPTQNREFQKNSKKIKKIKKYHYGFFSSQNGTGLVEKEKKKLSF